MILRLRIMHSLSIFTLNKIYNVLTTKITPKKKRQLNVHLGRSVHLFFRPKTHIKKMHPCYFEMVKFILNKSKQLFSGHIKKNPFYSLLKSKNQFSPVANIFHQLLFQLQNPVKKSLFSKQLPVFTE